MPLRLDAPSCQPSRTYKCRFADADQEGVEQRKQVPLGKAELHGGGGRPVRRYVLRGPTIYGTSRVRTASLGSMLPRIERIFGTTAEGEIGVRTQSVDCAKP